MGEIADMMLEGDLCEACGEAMPDCEAHSGFPAYCSVQCAKDRGADISQVCQCGGDDEEDWEAYKQERKEKKARNRKASLKMLRKNGFEPVMINDICGHFRIGDYDFWPATGTFLNRETKEKGRGVFNLLKELKK